MRDTKSVMSKFKRRLASYCDSCNRGRIKKKNKQFHYDDNTVA